MIRRTGLNGVTAQDIMTMEAILNSDDKLFAEDKDLLTLTNGWNMIRIFDRVNRKLIKLNKIKSSDAVGVSLVKAFRTDDASSLKTSIADFKIEL